MCAWRTKVHQITDSTQIEAAFIQHDGMRCCCGNLLARSTARGIEVKCKRCKRLVLLIAGGTQEKLLRPP